MQYDWGLRKGMLQMKQKPRIFYTESHNKFSGEAALCRDVSEIQIS